MSCWKIGWRFKHVEAASGCNCTLIFLSKPRQIEGGTKSLNSVRLWAFFLKIVSNSNMFGLISLPLKRWTFKTKRKRNNIKLHQSWQFEQVNVHIGNSQTCQIVKFYMWISHFIIIFQWNLCNSFCISSNYHITCNQKIEWLIYVEEMTGFMLMLKQKLPFMLSACISFC